jgi:hypothetical protein
MFKVVARDIIAGTPTIRMESGSSSTAMSGVIDPSPRVIK